MKLLVVVPSTESLKGAGVRIRYSRLIEPLAREGVRLLLKTVEQYSQILQQCDAVLISKLMDARATALAYACRQRGVLVGADLFDNYFSQQERTACRPQRRWLHQLKPHLDFAICSTEAMRDVVRQEAPDLPLHLLADGHGGRIDQLDLLRRSLREREARRQTTQDLSVIWFGMGDNPLFEVGLSDLEHHGEQLRSLEATGRKVHLRVLTNERALNDKGLQRLNRLPVSTTVEIWSEELETKRLLESDVAFLPVAKTEFSKVKSPNRGITALEHGCQVLTTDHSVYKVIEKFAYTNSTQLLKDLEAGHPKVSSSSLAELHNLMNEAANPAHEASRIRTFLVDMKRQRRPAKATGLAILNGIKPFQIKAEWCKRAGVFSVHSALGDCQDSKDLSFLLNPEGEAILLVSDGLMEQSMRRGGGAALKGVPSSQHTDGRRSYKLMDLVQRTNIIAQPRHALAIELALSCRTTGERLTLHSAVLDAVRKFLEELIPGIEVALNEEFPTRP